MANYRAMYGELFRAQTLAIADIEGATATLQSTADALRTAQQTTEAIYIESGGANIELLRRPEPQDDA